MKPTIQRKFKVLQSVVQAWEKEISRRADMFLGERKFLDDFSLPHETTPLPKEDWQESDVRLEILEQRIEQARKDFTAATGLQPDTPVQKILFEDFPPDSEIHT